MRYHWLILSSFFLLFVVIYSPAAHAKEEEMFLEKGMKGEGPVDIEADELSYDRETQVYEAHGQVEVSRGDMSLKADHVRMNMATKDLVAWGNVLLREGEDVIECQRLEVNVETRLGKIYEGRLFVKDQNFHITGGEIEKLGENHYRLRDGSFTACDAKRPPWKFTVKEIEVREMALGGLATAKGPILYLEDIPVLYFPWGAFPIRKERQIGFLIPQVGYSSKYDGPEFKTGFYWPFAKNMDTTLYLDYLGDRGFKEGLEFRYAFGRESKGQANVYYIRDQDTQEDLPFVVPKDRYAFYIQHEQKLPYDFYLKGDINRVSDHLYFQDFTDENIPETAQRAQMDLWSLKQLRSVVFGGKNWDSFNLLSQVAIYDSFVIPGTNIITATGGNETTVQTLPEISFYGLPQSLFKTPLFYEFSTSYTNFWREKLTEAQRGDIFPVVSYPMRLFNVLKFNPYLGGRETFYYSRNDPTGTFKGWESRETLAAGFQTSTEFYRVYDAETFPWISNLFKVAKWMHTIEPTVSYSYSPRVNQSDLPAFDAVDRIPYTNQITYGVTQSLVGRPEKEGITSRAFEYAKLKIFQSYSFIPISWATPPPADLFSWANPQPADFFTDQQGKKRSFSNITGELWLRFNPYLSAQWDTQFDPYRGNFEILNFLINIKDRRNDLVQIQYRDTRGSVREININARVKTIEPLYVFGAFYYNLLEGRWVQIIFGAEYQTQCWSAGFVLTSKNEFTNALRTLSKEVKFQFYVNLLNLGSVGGSKPYLMRLN
jgi:LPS-assembly protein